MAYDAAKAKEVNQLIEQGIDPSEAIAMAGIPADQLGNYDYDPTTSRLGQQYGPPVEESVFDPRQDVAESVFDPGTTYGGPATQESVFDPRQDVAESVFDPNAISGPLNQGDENVFDPRQDVGESVFDPASALPNPAVAAAAEINNPYYGLSPQQLQALGGADPTDPYIRARLGIPQLPGSTLNAGGFGALNATGVPLIDNAISAISGFAASLSSFFGVPTKPAVTATGTTTGAPSSTGVDTAAIAKDATTIKEQNPELDAAATENLTNIQEASTNTAIAEQNIDINNQSIQANEQAQTQALEQQRQAQAIIDQNNAELADETISDDRRAELEANNAAQFASIAQNAAVIDEAQANIDEATANNEQQVDTILENQYVVSENAEAYRINTTGGVDENGDPVGNTADDPEYDDYGAPEYVAETDGPLTDPGTQELTEEESAALFDEAEAAEATIEAPPTAAPGQPGGAPLLTDAEIAAIYGTTDPQEVGAIQGTTIISDEARAALSDPETIKAQQAQNQFVAENPIKEIDVTTVPLSDEESAALLDEAENTPPPTQDAEVNAETDPEIAAAEAAANAELVADPEATIPEDVDPEEDPGLAELEEPPGTEGEITDLAEPVDPESDPELLAGEEEEPFTDLAEPVDPDADAELEQLAGPEEEEPYTDLAEPVDPDADPELEELGDPDLQDGEITELAEPVDPDADPELEQLGDPALREEDDSELEQLSGPADVDPANDPGLSDEEILARQNPDGLSDEEILARDQANSEAATKQKAKDQATIQARFKQPSNGDWRVRLRLAPGADYLYQAQEPGILAPLKGSDGVVFPYTPSIGTVYQAKYSPYDLTHSNYRGYFYQNSAVDAVQIQAMFTAQDTKEAEYLLAVIHFFRSVTKMFYGKDPQRGAPPPLVYLYGLGQYQFNNHACVVQSFTYNLPSDVDYIRTQPNNYGGNLLNKRNKLYTSPSNPLVSVIQRLSNAALPAGATPSAPSPGQIQQSVISNTSTATYVPTKIELSITLLPIQTRSQVSQQFSLKEFANGNGLKGGFW